MKQGDQVRIRVVSADIWGSLRLLNAKEIEIFALEQEDDLTYSFALRRKLFPIARTVMEQRGDSVRVQGMSWLFCLQQSIISRPLLYSGLLFLTLLSFLLPTRILCVQVEGNTVVPTRKILEAAENAGVHLMTPCARVRSERMKNALLSAIPELQWAGINTYGCRAVISVRERTEQPSAAENPEIVSSIVADRDGVVESVTALRGTSLCQPGQAVRKGQILISGYTDCGISIQATRAEGEVYAQTLRTVRALTPSYEQCRGKDVRTQRNFSVVIGKKRINLWKGSGISDITCGRISTQYHLVLPGGFSLPFYLVCEKVTQGAMSQVDVNEQNAQRSLESFAQDYLLSQMIAGRIMYADRVLEMPDGAYLLTEQFLCTEMIGREHLEMGDRNEQNRGADR